MSDGSSMKRKFQTAWAVHLAMMGGLLIYVLLIEIASGRFFELPPLQPTEGALNIRYLIYGAAILVVLVLRWVRPVFVRKTPVSEGEAAGKLLAQTLFTASLCEIPVLLGVVLYVLLGYKPDFYFLLIVSLILFFMYFPRLPRWQEWWHSVQGREL